MAATAAIVKRKRESKLTNSEKNDLADIIRNGELRYVIFYFPVPNTSCPEYHGMNFLPDHSRPEELL